MSDKPFDMPPLTAGFAAQGRWVIDRLMADLALTENQAAGIVGNLGYESSGFRELREYGQPEGQGGYGWAQWTGPRRVLFLGWCMPGKDWRSDAANYGFLVYELRGAYAYVVDELRHKTSLEDCVFLVGVKYETPAGTTPTHLPGYSARLAYARHALTGAPPAAEIAET